MGGDAVQRHGGSDGGIEAGDLARLTLGLGGAGGGLRGRDGRDLFGALGAASVELERVPAKAETAQDDGRRSQSREADDDPAGRGQAPEKDKRPHGKTFRSSSKCGPSRKDGQSPPQTRATPLAFAAALMASAMRG